MLRECSIGPERLPIVSFGQFSKMSARTFISDSTPNGSLKTALPTEVVIWLMSAKGRGLAGEQRCGTAAALCYQPVSS